jgi:hypothetical protein
LSRAQAPADRRIGHDTRVSRDTTSTNNGSDVLAGLPRTRPQRPSSRRGHAIEQRVGNGAAAKPATVRATVGRAKPAAAKARPPAAPKAKPSNEAATPVRDEAGTTALPPSKEGGLPNPARLVSDAFHAVDELRSRGEQTIKSALSRLRKH